MIGEKCFKSLYTPTADLSIVLHKLILDSEIWSSEIKTLPLLLKGDATSNVQALIFSWIIWPRKIYSAQLIIGFRHEA